MCSAVISFPSPFLWFSLVALEIWVLADGRVAEADIWFHLRNAQELLTRHAFLEQIYTPSRSLARHC